MKQARTGSLLPTIFMVVALGILHTMQKAGAPLPSPAKDVVVAIGLLIFGAAIVYARSSRQDGEASEIGDGATLAIDGQSAEDRDERRASVNEYDLSA